MFNKLFKYRSTETEMIDHQVIDEKLLQKNLKEFEIFNRWLGSHRIVLQSLTEVFQRFPKMLKEKIVIADIGCGAGDILRMIADFSNNKKIQLQGLGLDINSTTIQYAKALAKHYQNLIFRVQDALSLLSFVPLLDIVIINHVTHHMTDEQIIELLKTLKQNTQFAIIINDLQRHMLSYYAIQSITRLFFMSPLAKHDGPTSVLRSFKQEDWVRILKKANISNYSLTKTWPFHWKLIIWCKD